MTLPATQEEKLPLTPLSIDEARKPLAILFSAYPEPFWDKSASHAQALIDAKVNAYLLAVDKIPGWAIEQAVTDFIQGKVERRARGKLPAAEEIAFEARKHVDAERARQLKQREIENQIAESEEDRKRQEYYATPQGREEKARMAERFAEIMKRAGLKSMPKEEQ